MTRLEELKGKIEAREARVGVIGLGYVGLPLAVELALGRFHVTGFDVDEWKVGELNAGRSYIPDVKTADLAQVVASGHFVAATDMSALADMDCIDIAVPTPLSKFKDPDVSYIQASTESVRKTLRKGQVIILESTTYPGTTRELMLPALESTGLVVGKDFFLSFSPERVDPGNAVYGTRNTPKVIGGITPDCLAVTMALYQPSIDTLVPVSSPEAAELVKILENTFRSVNIGLVNELALMSAKLNINVWEVIDAAATKPFGFMPFYPGPGIGGHCIPLDPFYLSWKAKQFGFESRFIELAGVVNGQMPHYTVEKVAEALNRSRKAVNGAKVLVLGVAYKKDISDVRESPALDILQLLSKKGAHLSYCDPYVPEVREAGMALIASPFSAATLRKADCVVIVTNHAAFDYEMVAREAKMIVDTRNALKGHNGRKIVKL